MKLKVPLFTGNQTKIINCSYLYTLEEIIL
jgi:hypothetical protein